MSGPGRWGKLTAFTAKENDMVRNQGDRFVMNALTVLIALTAANLLALLVLIFSPDREMVRVYEPNAVPARLDVVD